MTLQWYGTASLLLSEGNSVIAFDPTGADVLVLLFQGRSDPSHLGESLVRRLRPKAVLLDHYDDSFPPMTARIDTTAFEALIQEKY